jgi:hypothetical protein
LLFRSGIDLLSGDFDDDQMSLPIIYGLTCPHPEEQQAIAQQTVKNISIFILK